jgi:type I restriction-modification system DNA methylase subunit
MTHTTKFSEGSKLKTNKGLEQKANMRNNFQFNNVSSFICAIVDLLNGAFMRWEFQKIILSFTVRYRLDYALERVKNKVFAKEAQLKAQVLGNWNGQLRHALAYAFCNTNNLTFEGMLSGDANLARNLKKYLLDSLNKPQEILDAFKQRKATLRSRV